MGTTRISKATAKQLGLLPKSKPRSRERRAKAQPARLFEAACVAHGLTEPIAEFCFAPPRKWRFDFAWPEAMVAVERQGGLFIGGRHTRGPALLKEYEKINESQVLGWCVFFVTPQQMDSGQIFELLERLIPPANGVRMCRRCGCTDNNCRQCLERTGEPCYWVEENLCSACEGKP